jgi:hypothetical protein
LARSDRPMPTLLRAAVPIALAAAALVWGLSPPAMVQPQAYHLFADSRPLLGVPNAGDTLSNLAFLVVGVLGLAFLWHEQARGAGEHFESTREMRPYWVFFFGVALTSAGSAWYHLAPDDARLVWDRLPMTIAFMSLVAAVAGERLDPRWSEVLLWPLVLLGLASVVYWRWSALAGFENLRPYLAVQFGSIAVVLAIAALYRSRYTQGALIFALAAAYGAAKVLEVYDRAVYGLGLGVSGHTLKHLAAAAGVWMLLRSLELRRPR